MTQVWGRKENAPQRNQTTNQIKSIDEGQLSVYKNQHLNDIDLENIIYNKIKKKLLLSIVCVFLFPKFILSFFLCFYAFFSVFYGLIHTDVFNMILFLKYTQKGYVKSSFILY